MRRQLVRYIDPPQKWEICNARRRMETHDCKEREGGRKGRRAGEGRERETERERERERLPSYCDSRNDNGDKKEKILSEREATFGL